MAKYLTLQANASDTLYEFSFELVTGKKAELMIEDYRYAERRGNTQLWHVYGRCSDAKQRAFEECDEIRRLIGGGIMYICSYCTCFFTLIYLVNQNGKNYIVKETPTHSYICEVELASLR